MNYRNFSQELLDAQKRGAIIVCSAAPYEGTQVHHAPRRLRDPRPWTFTENGPSYDGMYRYSGRECHAEYGHWVGQQLWYTTPENGPILVDVNHVDRREGTAQIKAGHWDRVSTVPLDKLSKSYPAR